MRSPARNEIATLLLGSLPRSGLMDRLALPRLTSGLNFRHTGTCQAREVLLAERVAAVEEGTGGPGKNEFHRRLLN